MAGRGTDILLGGNPSFRTNGLVREFFETDKNIEFTTKFNKEKFTDTYQSLLKQPLSELEQEENPEMKEYVSFYKEILEQQKIVSKNEGEDIKKFGGLHVIGTERHESRRIDNQLRGRAGRQGDPGSSRFFLCLEDRLLRIFGGDQILNVMQNIGFDDSTPIQSPILNNSLESAQKKVEAFYYDTRKQLFEYDQALNMQRNCVYTERRRMFEQQNLRSWLLDYAERSLDDLFICLKSFKDEQAANFLTTKLQNLLGVPFSIKLSTAEADINQYLLYLQQQIQITYDLKELEMESIEKGLLREIEKSFILQQIDYSWMEHLQKITFLRDSIRWRAYGQKDPLTEYKKEAFNYFLIMLARIRHRVVYFVLRSKIILL
jgi:preprotein translocase subunit SecA